MMNARPHRVWRLALAFAPIFDSVVPLLADAREGLPANANPYHFDRTISRETLERYLSRAITMEGMLNGRGNLQDNIRMLKELGAKFIGRSLCLWGG